MSDQYIIQTLLRTERDDAYAAIDAILKAQQGVLAGVLDGADLDEAIYAAADLLPAEMRGDVPPPKQVKQRRRKSTGFEDLGL